MYSLMLELDSVFHSSLKCAILGESFNKKLKGETEQ